MRRLFLVAGVASLAIAGAAAAKPGGGGGGNPHGGGDGGGPHGGGGPPAFAGGGNGHGGGGGGGPPAFAGGGGHGNGGGPHGGGGFMFMGGGGGGHGRGGPPVSMGGGGQFRGYGPAYGRGGEGHGRGSFMGPQARTFAGGGRGRGGGTRSERFGGYAGGGYRHGGGRQHAYAFEGGHGHGRQGFARQEGRAFAGAGSGHGASRHGNALARQQGGRVAGQPTQMAQGAQVRGGHAGARQQQGVASNFQRLGGAAALGAAGSQLANQQPLYQQSWGGNQQPLYQQNWGGVSPYQTLSYGNNVQILPVQQVEQFVGVPVANVASYAAIAPLPASIQYLYPDTPDYYYQWGDGYLYQVDRSDNLISALLPLLAGGYLPGQYLPQPYMASYVPNYYGFDSFYPDYGGVCNRYYDGVIYQVDCGSGYVENVVPMYAGGYGVGQLLPSAYTYYNVPTQYRNLYYNTADYGYWYSPGAIYQYDPRTSVITSVAALMSPGFAVGQPLPAGYDVYNVPYAYRATYYDTPDAWYRYSNGYIYQVDPVTQLVTAIVASLLT